jgi:ribosome-binding ATPase YchF (GTP1/OBG family)
MKIGLVGYAGAGKTTVFTWLTGAKADPAAMLRGQIGVARVPDERLDWLSAHFHPKKTTPATLEIVDTPGLLTTERKDNPRRLAVLREADGLLVVLTGHGDLDPAAELQNFRSELYFADLEIITNRLTKVEAQLKKPRSAKDREIDLAEQDLLKRLATALEAGQSAHTLGLTEDQEKSIRSFQLFSLKPELVLLNIGDARIGKPLPVGLPETARQAPVKLEMELLELPEADRTAFMQDLGLTGFSRDETIRWLFYGMGRIVFFTVGEDECRAWPIHQGDTAQQGAGTIHTDLAEGFVRAEVVGYADFRQVGSMKEAKAKGVYRLESKTYVVKDGDIMHILANR